jgi:osmoprotectant transport system ATP-binding protein
VLVTHDIDEALALADRIVLLDQGRIVQQGTPLELLTAPANDFVRDFFGRSDRGIKLLSLETVAQRVRPGHVAGEPITAAMSLREALSVFVARGSECLPVIGEQGEALGVLHFSDLIVQKALS